MEPNNSGLSSEAIQMIVSSVTQRGSTPLSEIAAERLLNAIARAQQGVPTGVQTDTNSVSHTH